MSKKKLNMYLQKEKKKKKTQKSLDQWEWSNFRKFDVVYSPFWTIEAMLNIFL